jgi:hypothetical protein
VILSSETSANFYMIMWIYIPEDKTWRYSLDNKSTYFENIWGIVDITPYIIKLGCLKRWVHRSPPPSHFCPRERTSNICLLDLVVVIVSPDSVEMRENFFCLSGRTKRRFQTHSHCLYTDCGGSAPRQNYLNDLICNVFHVTTVIYFGQRNIRVSLLGKWVRNVRNERKKKGNGNEWEKFSNTIWK